MVSKRDRLRSSRLWLALFGGIGVLLLLSVAAMLLLLAGSGDESPPASPTQSPVSSPSASPTVTGTASPVIQLKKGSLAVARTQGSTLVLRSGAGIEFPRTGSLYDGEVVTLVSDRTRDAEGDYFWWYVRRADAETGWVQEGPTDGSVAWLVAAPPPSTPTTSSTATPTQTATASPTATAVPSPTATPIGGGGLGRDVKAIVVNLGGSPLMLREGPSQTFGVIGRLREGEVVTLRSDLFSDEANAYRWWRVELGDGTTGWAAHGPVDSSATWFAPAEGYPPMLFRSFAVGVAGAIEDDDVDFLWRTASRMPFVCNEIAHWDVYACINEPVGAVVDTISWQNPFRGTLYNEAQYKELVRWALTDSAKDVTDDFGGPELTVFATAASTLPWGDPEYYIITTRILQSIRGPVVRSVHVFKWQIIDGAWTHTAFWTSEWNFTAGTPSARDWLTGDCGYGGTAECLHWQRWP